MSPFPQRATEVSKWYAVPFIVVFLVLLLVGILLGPAGSVAL